MEKIASLPESIQLRILAMLEEGIAKDGARRTVAATTSPALAVTSSDSCTCRLRPGTQCKKCERSLSSEAKTSTQPERAELLAQACQCSADVRPSPAQIFGLAIRLGAHGFTWCDGIVSGQSASELLRCARRMALRPANMSSSHARFQDPSLRGDLIAWVPTSSSEASVPTSSSESSRSDDGSTDAMSEWASLPALAQVTASLRAIVEQLNARAAERGDGEVLQMPRQAMLAHFGANARYVRHRDVSPLVRHRRVTAIFYLNEAWTKEDGGELAIYLPGSSAQVLVEPHFCRLALFRSDLEHEVMRTASDRWALTFWLSVDRNTAHTPLTPCRGGDTGGSHVHASTSAGAVAATGAAAAATTTKTSPGVTTAPAVVHTSLSNEPACAVAGSGITVHSTPVVTPSPVGAEADSSAASLLPSRVVAPSNQQPPTIFVSIASYRDPECPFTIADLFRRAASPSRVVVGVCFQCDDADDADCVDLGCVPAEMRPNVRQLSMPWRSARGPCHARQLIQSRLFASEDYYLQIDSHTRFAPNWDEALIRMLSRCASAKPVISTYPLPYEGEGSTVSLSTETHLTLLCTQDAARAFDSDSMLRFRARFLRDAPVAPVPSAFWAAGFSFSSGALVHEVPYDPHLPFLFFGEEVSMALRMWTRGWDLFAPDRHVVFHRWTRCYRSTFWEVPGGAEAKRASQQRVRRLLTGRWLAAPSARDGAPDEAQLHDEEGAVAAEKVGAAPYRLEDGSHGRTPSPEEVSSDGTRSVFEASANDVRAHDAVWGVGPIRTLRDYETFAGVDFSTCTVSAQSNQGGLPSEQCFWDRFAELSAFLEGTRVDGGRN